MAKAEISKGWALIILVLGILLLLGDLAVINFPIGPWTLVFLLIGLVKTFK